MARIPGVFIVDQDPDARFLAQRLVQEAGFAPCGEAAPGTEAVAFACEAQPDVVLVAIKEPLFRALQTIESLVHTLPQAPVIAYATSDDLEMVRRAMLAGARDFLRAPFKAPALERSLVAALESEERRRLRETDDAAIGKQAMTIAVFGAKGGIGKTTIATNLAVALARSAQQTALVDADDTFGDAASSLGLPSSYSVVDAVLSADGADDDITKWAAAHDSGLAVYAAPESPFAWQDASGERVQQFLARIGRRFDVVVVDTSGSLGERALAVLRSANLILWITSPEYSSVRDSLQALQAVATLGSVPEDRIRLVLNVTTRDLEVRPAAIQEALTRDVFWTLPFEPGVRRSVQLGQAYVDASPESVWSQSIAQLALVLGGGERRAVPRRRSFRLWPRLRAARNETPRLRLREAAP